MHTLIFICQAIEQMIELRGFDPAPLTPQIFANAAIE